MIFFPDIKEIKKHPKYLENKKSCLNFLSKNLNDDWELFFNTHLNGLSIDIVLTNPKKGMQLINFYDEDSLIENNIDKIWRKLIRAKDEIPQLYSPRIKTFLMTHDRKWGSATPNITVTIAAPKMSTDKIEELLKEKREELELNQEKLDNYYNVISREIIESSQIKKAIPTLNFGESILMKQEFIDDLKYWLIYPDEKRERNRKIVLDAKQKKLTTERTQTGYRRIKGAAGSGKSMVLALRAVNLALQGKRVLILSFNITLYKYLYSLILRTMPRVGDELKHFSNITLSHYHGWIEQEVWDPIQFSTDGDNPNLFVFSEKEIDKIQKQMSKDKKSIVDIEFEFIDNRIESVIGKLPEENKYDAILVDEGQDWNLKKWNNVRRAIVDGGELMLVADQTQDIYGTWVWTDGAMIGAGFPGDWTTLEETYRLPPSYIKVITDFATKFIDKDIRTIPKPVPEQKELGLDSCHMDWKQLPDFADTTSKCVDVISSTLPLLMKQKFAISDITFLAIDNNHGKKVVHQLRKDKKINVTHTFGFLPDEKNTQGYSDKKYQRALKMIFSIDTKQIKATTIHSFKGWESPALIVQIERQQKQDINEEYIAAVYTALTRLRRGDLGASYIYVICSDPYFDEYQKTWNT
jgi:hypothetical protein